MEKTRLCVNFPIFIMVHEYGGNAVIINANMINSISLWRAEEDIPLSCGYDYREDFRTIIHLSGTEETFQVNESLNDIEAKIENQMIGLNDE